jgi:hypothetical protein
MPPTVTPGTIIRETLTLQRDLLNGLKMSELDRWIGESDIRKFVLQNMLFGRIRWPKSNGKPLSTTLNEAFTILHYTMVIKVAELPGGGIVETISWASLPEPFKFDELDDSDHYTVGFFAQIPLPFPQQIQPTFADGVAWPHILTQYRSIDPFDWTGSETGEPVLIPDFTVSLRLW